MHTRTPTTRRTFFGKAGAALFAPVAATAAAAGNDTGDDLAARVAELEDVTAIRVLQRTFTELVSSGSRDELAALFADPAAAQVEPGVRGVAGDAFGEHDIVKLGGDGTATASLRCTIELATAIGPTCTLVEMARLQGDGFVRRTEPRVLESTYVKHGGVWKIARAVFRTV